MRVIVQEIQTMTNVDFTKSCIKALVPNSPQVVCIQIFHKRYISDRFTKTPFISPYCSVLWLYSIISMLRVGNSSE